MRYLVLLVCFMSACSSGLYYGYEKAKAERSSNHKVTNIVTPIEQKNNLFIAKIQHS